MRNSVALGLVVALLHACTGSVDGPADGSLADGGIVSDARALEGGAIDDGSTRDADGRDASGSGDACVPTTCAAEGADCGSLSDGCGRSLSCGRCTGDQVCGGLGRSNVCATPVPCGAAPAGATSEQAEALRLVNDVRQRVGVPCATMIPEINAASQAHADYGQRNSGDATCRSSGHDETEGCPGYTGARFSSRMSAAGYSGGGRSEIAHFVSGPAAAISGWLGTLYHRIPIVLPSTDHFGYGDATGWNVMDFGRAQSVDADGVWFYPYDGSTVGARGGNEIPAPPAEPDGCTAGRGTFISIMFARGATVSIDTYELLGPSGPEEVRWVPPGTSSLLHGTYSMVPCLLTSGATYTIRVAGMLNEAPFDRTSTFMTR